MSDTHLPLPKERNLHFAAQVEQETIEAITKEIISINEHDTHLTKIYGVYDFEYTPKPINLYIDSYGGNVYQILGLISIIDKSETPVYTYVTGAAMSAGFMLLTSGHKRFAYKHSTIMIHQVSSSAWGTLKEMEENVAETKRLQKVLESIIVNKTRVSKAKLKEIYTNKTDWFLTSTEAVEWGIVDQIV